MASQRGRCTNTDYCSVAVSGKIIEVPDGAPLVCDKCGEPLQNVQETRQKGRRKLSIVNQLLVLAIGGGAVAWKLSGAPIPFLPADTTAPAVTSQAQAAPVTTAAIAPLPPPAPPAAVQPVMQSVPPPPAPKPAPAKPPVVAASRTVLLRLAGSDVMAKKLVRRLASGYLALIGDSNISAEAGEAADSIDIIGLQTGQQEVIQIASTTNTNGFTALLRGSADVVMAEGRVSPADAERLSTVGDLLSPANEHVIAVQALATIVGPGNQLPSLTVQQLRDVLAGRVNRWADVGGGATPITVYIVDGESSLADWTKTRLVDSSELAPSIKRLPTDEAVAAAVAHDRTAIGFVSAGSQGSARSLAISEAGALPVAPTDIAIATEDYPLTRRLYFYNGDDQASGFVRRFNDYISSPAGQAAVEAAGLVPLTIKTESEAVPATASDRFRQFVAGSSRISVDFRFQPNSVDLDGRSAKDLDRLAAYVKQQRINPARLILAAFADNSGQPATNTVVAQKRAEAVAAALGRVGLAPGKMASFGAELPVADNATADGREHNRRVEVYLAP